MSGLLPSLEELNNNKIEPNKNDNSYIIIFAIIIILLFIFYIICISGKKNDKSHSLIEQLKENQVDQDDSI